MNTQLATAVKGVTWVDLLLGIEVGGEKPFPLEKRGYISSLISRDLKLKHPEMEFKTRKDCFSGEDVVIVKRTK